MRGPSIAAAAALLLTLTAATSAHALTPADLVAGWEGEFDAMDAGGIHHGVFTGSYIPGVGGLGVAFGTTGGGFVSVPDDPAWDLTYPSGEFAVELWVRFDETPHHFGDMFPSAALIGHSSGGGTADKWALFHNGADLVVHMNGPTFYGGPVNVLSAPWSPTLGMWHHVVWQQTGAPGPGGVSELWINGALAMTAPIAFPIPPAPTPLEIGIIEGIGGFAGGIDQVWIWDSFLSPEEITSRISSGGAVPTPEIGTLVLMGVGVLALVGVAYRRRPS